LVTMNTQDDYDKEKRIQVKYRWWRFYLVTMNTQDEYDRGEKNFQVKYRWWRLYLVTMRTAEGTRPRFSRLFS